MTDSTRARESSLLRGVDRRLRAGEDADEGRLLERDRHLSELATLISRSWDCPTGAVVVEGRVGHGKTALLGAACRAARAAGYEVLRATVDISGLELLPLLRQLDGPWREDGTCRGEGELERRLEHLMARIGALAQGGGVLVAVDDAQWLGAESVAWLGELIGPGTQPGIRVLLSALPRAPQLGLRPLDDLLCRPQTRTMALGPLSEQTVTTLAELHFGRAGGASLRAFAAECHSDTGGVPGLVFAVFRDVEAKELDPTPDLVAATASAAVARSVLRRLSLLPADCTRALEALTVAGESVDSEVVAQATGLSLSELDLACAGLVALDLLHTDGDSTAMLPVVRRSFYAEIAASKRSGLHLRIAQGLKSAGATEKSVAAHLMAADPRRRAWVAEELLQAARAVRAEGDAAAALGFMRRALLEQPALSADPQVLLDLACLEAACDPGAATAHLSQCLDRGCPPASLKAAACLARDIAWRAQHPASDREEVSPLASVIDRLLSALGPTGPEATGLLVARALVVGDADKGLAGILVDTDSAGGDDPGLDALRDVAHLALRSDPAGPVASRLARLVGDGDRAKASGCDSELWARALLALARSGDFEAAERHSREAAQAACSRGELSAEAEFTLSLAMSLRLRGMLEQARLCASEALSIREGSDWRRRHDAVSCLVGCLIDLGRLEQAQEALAARPGLETLVPTLEAPSLLVERGRLRLRQGSLQCAVDDITTAGRMAVEAGIGNPAVTSWRRAAVAAMAAQGAAQRAVPLAEEELSLARATGLEWLVGCALYTCALVRPGTERLQLLSQAVDRLVDSPLQLDAAAALIELGSALLEGGDAVAARTRLWRGLEVAARLGASPLVERALPMLRRSGARPRRAAFSGPSSLTPSEARVVRLAAEGLKNAEIAARMFLANKTVEGHLMRGYRKLGVSSRAELKAVLPGDALPGELDVRSGDPIL